MQESERLDWLVEEWLKPMLDRFQVVYEEGIADGWMKDIPFPQLIMMITASASQFFSMAPLVRALYDVDANCPEQTLAHSDAVVEVAVNAILRQPVTQQSEAAPV